MKAITSVATVLGIAAVCTVFPAAAAGKYDGSAAMICAAFVVHDCAPGEACQPRLAEEVGLPALFRVDVKAKKVRNLDAAKRKESTIRNSASVNGRLVLYGGEAGRGWVVTIHEETGKMTGAVATDGEGFVVFGQCALP